MAGSQAFGALTTISPGNPPDEVAMSASGGSGGSQSPKDEREQYYLIYRAICQILGIPLNPKIAAMAYKTRQPGSGFLSLVRKFDPNYVKTNDFRNRAAAYIAKWKEILPMVKLDYGDIKRFVRSDYTNDRVEQYIMRTKAFRKYYPYFEYGKDDFRTYIQHEQALARALASANLGALTRRRKELFHKLDMTPEEVSQRIEELISGHDASDLMFGVGVRRKKGFVNDYIFDTPGNLARRKIIQDAMRMQQGLNESQLARAQLRRDERGKVIQTGI